MVKRLAALVFIFVCTALAWAVLGTNLYYRTYSSDAQLRGRVISTWGAPQEQAPPTATYDKIVLNRVVTIEGKQEKTRLETTRVPAPLPLEKSALNVALDLEHRQKGLLWYSTYKVAFAGEYLFENPNAKEEEITVRLALPAEKAIYDGLVLATEGRPLELAYEGNTVSGRTRLGPGQPLRVSVAYRSHGLDTWKYRFGSSLTPVKDFTLELATNFEDLDFPEDTLSPTEKTATPAGWLLTWRYASLLSGYQVGVALPQKLQPGPLAARISYFAPVSLFFFFFLLFLLTTVADIDLHPMNYFFLAAAFFAFHLLLGYLADHISIHLAFLICSLVSIFLVVSYLQRLLGWRFALLKAGAVQFLYLVVFSYTFFLEGYTGLAITIGSILTLFVVMQMTAPVRWAEKFSPRPANSAARP